MDGVSVDAIQSAHTPYYDQLLKDYPNAILSTYGKEVGLPEGQMGNSEVGHLNLGAGRIVYQDLARINKAIQEETLASMPEMLNLIQYAKDYNKPIHLMGLLSDGGVHAHINHVKELCQILKKSDVDKVYIHAFTDGRDTDPRGGKGYIADLQSTLDETGYSVASMVGRYYAMDRDTRWERIKVAYDLLIHGRGKEIDDPIAALQSSYDADITDEFLEPVICDKSGVIKEGDAVLFFNYRTDRPRQIVRALTQENFEDQDMHKQALYMVTMTQYDQNYENVRVIYQKEDLVSTIGEVISKNGLSQVRIAETEKYPHVTFFFNGGREEAFEGEDRILIPSPKVATYDLAPAMSAHQITSAICERIMKDPPHFICLNFANADMVGHTGDLEAAKKACETVDNCLSEVVESALDQKFEIMIIADHGNADIMINEDGSAHTAHTTNPVPVIYVSDRAQGAHLERGKLADISPTLLSLMEVERPQEMSGNILVTFPEG